MYKNDKESIAYSSRFPEAEMPQIQVFNTPPKVFFTEELIVADGTCPQISSLLTDARCEAIELGLDSDPLRAITQELQSRREAGIPVGTLHIIAHGASGSFRMGGIQVDEVLIRQQAASIASWQVKHIALWSCAVGMDSPLVTMLADLTGARVWATASVIGRDHTELQSVSETDESVSRPSLARIVGEAAVASMDFTLAEVSLVFSEGYLGTQDTTTNKTNNIKLFAAAGISRVAFVQTDANGDGKFGDSGLQGNDLSGALRIYRTDGTIVTLTGALNWRETTGSKVEVFGFIFDAGQNNASLGITGGSTANTSTNLGLKALGSSFSFTAGENRSGNAATAGLLDSLNAALASSAQPSSIALVTGSVVEGTNLVYTVTLDKATPFAQDYLFAFSGTATAGTDYNTTYTFSNGVTRNADGTLSVPVGVSSFTVTVTTSDDALVETSETAILTIGEKSATGTITDNDAVIAPTPSVSVAGSAKVSEGSNAVFTVSLSAAPTSPTELSLTLGASGDQATAGVDYGDLSAYYYVGDVKTPLTVTAGKISLPANVSQFYVAVPTLDDDTFEGSESLSLTAAVTDGSQGSASSSIVDDGTGTLYDDKGQPIPGTPDDDRMALGVTGGVYNEGQGVALFTVTAPQGDLVSLALSDVDTTGLNSDTLIRYSTDGGVSWQPYRGAFAAPMTGQAIQVAVDISGEHDDVLEVSEQFRLTVSSGEQSKEALATIRDDGTGDILTLNRAGNPVFDGGTVVVDTSTPRDDDTPALTVSGLDGVSEGANTVFTVTLSNPVVNPLDISLTLGAGDDTATVVADYGQVLDAYYYAGTVKVPLVPAADGRVTLPALVDRFYVAVASLDDESFEGSEALTLAAALPDGQSDNDTSSIVDDGTGVVYDDKGQPVPGAVDDDRVVTINSPVVNEASPYAVFTLDGEPGQRVSLTLTDGTASIADYDRETLEFSRDDGLTWTPYVSGEVTFSEVTGALLVRTPVKQDITYEGAETFTLVATNTGGKQAFGTATLLDDGRGDIFNPDGSKNISTPRDDDRILKVENITVNEDSPYAVFRVSGIEGQQLVLNLEETGTAYAPVDGDAKIGTDTGTLLQVFDGDQWSDYQPETTVTYPVGSTTLLVRVAIQDDGVFEKQESFKLKAATDDMTSYGIGIITDDGQGPIFNESGAVDPTALRDDDRALKINSIDVNEGSGYAVFTVSANSGSRLELALVKTGAGVDHATLGVDTATQLEYLQGDSWTAYVPGSKVLVEGGELFVRVAVINDPDREMPESFRLLASSDTSGITAFGTATIQSNGTGDVWLQDNTQPSTQAELVAADFVLDDDFDLDGIAPNVEEILATLSSSSGNGGNDGDLNADGKQDAEQNALATLAWISVEDFRKGLGGTLTEVRPIVSLAVASSAATLVEAPVGDGQYQLSAIRVIPQESTDVGGKPVTDTITAEGTRIVAPWDPILFTVSPHNAVDQLADIDPDREGIQILTEIDISRSGIAAGDFNGYLKYVSQAAIEAAASQGIALRTLDGSPITTADWYDFTQRKNVDGSYYGDGARYTTENGRIVSIQLTMTDNAFGDNDMTVGTVVDPGMPVLLIPNQAPVVDLASGDAATLNRVATFREGRNAVTFGESGALNVSDADGINLTRLSITVDSGTLESGDQISVGSTVIDMTQASAGGVFNTGERAFNYTLTDEAGTRTLTFSTDVPVDQSEYDALLDALSFSSSSENFTDNGKRVFEITASDEYTTSAAASLSINMDAVNWIYSSTDVILPNDVDNVVLNRVLIQDSWDLSCLPDWLRQSVKIKDRAPAKVADLAATGNARDNQMIGNEGNNTLLGGTGDDGLYGIDGRDLLLGEAGNDTLSGVNGKDVLVGGAGRDELTGGNGKDKFRYLALEDSGVGADNRDVITDFTTKDRLKVNKIDANPFIADDQAFSYIEDLAFSGTPGQLRFEAGILQADVNGDGIADLEIELLGVTTLPVDNIIL